MHPHTLVNSLQERVRALEIDFHHAWWESQTKACPEADQRRAAIELELRRVKGDPQLLAEVNAALGQEIHDPLLRRQLEILRFTMIGNQMDEAERARLVEIATSVEAEFASYRPEIDGKRINDNEIQELLRKSDDESERRRAWEASKEIGGRVAERVRELARLRNKAARDLGFADYYRMSLELQEIREEWLFSVMDELERLTDDAFATWKDALDDRLRRRFSVAELYPWHYADPFFQVLPRDIAVDLDVHLGDASAVELSLKTFATWGIDLTSVIDRSDLYPRENKCQHAFCLDVDRSGNDVRILANVVPGEQWVEIMLHESGHAVYDVCISPNLPYLLHRPAHTFVTEAIAIMSGRFARDPAWLSAIAGVDREQVTPIEDDLLRASAAQSLLFARWGLVMVHFERDLYSDPERDLDSRWWDLVARFQRLTPPPDRHAPDWAAKIHLGAAPAYYQNYLLGEMLASQLRATCERECGGLVANAEAGQLLVERVFEKGALERWDAVVEAATGRALSAADFARELERA